MAPPKGKFKGKKRVGDQLNELLDKYRESDLIDLNVIQLAILRSLCSFANRDTMLAWPSIPNIGNRTGLAQSSVKKHLKVLIDRRFIAPAGKVRMTSNNGWEQYVNRYRVTLTDAEAALTSSPEVATTQLPDGDHTVDPLLPSSDSRTSNQVTAASDSSDSRESYKVTAAPRPQTCSTTNQSSVSDTTPPQASTVDESSLSGQPKPEQADSAGLVKAESFPSEKTETTATTTTPSPLSMEEFYFVNRCYDLSPVEFSIHKFTKDEAQLLRSLLQQYTMDYLNELLDFIETDDDSFWRDRFITTQNDTPLTRPVHYFCRSAETLHYQYQKSLQPVPKRTATTTATAAATTMASNGAAAEPDAEYDPDLELPLSAYLASRDDDEL